MKRMDKGRKILSILEENGYEAFFVGGCVRDFLLERPIHDVDICTSARPDVVQSVFAQTVPTGIKHGTVTVLLDNMSFEVTTYRSDSKYDDFRRPNEVTYEHTLKKDLERRDFTINAMAMDRNGRIFDYYQGQEDLIKKRIQTVGKAQDRFQEDALRMLRAVRFSAQLGFTIDEQVLHYIRLTVHQLKHISMERITMEFEKIMASDNPQQGIKYFLEGYIAKRVEPFHLVEQACIAMQHLPLSDLTPIERWLLLLANLRPTEVEPFLDKLRLPKRFVKELHHLYQWLIDSNGKTNPHSFSYLDLVTMNKSYATSVLKVNQVRTEGVVDPKAIKEVEKLFQTLPIQHQRELCVSGKDLIQALDKKPGPWIQSAIQVLMNAVLQGEVENKKQRLIAYMLECDVREFNSDSIT